MNYREAFTLLKEGRLPHKLVFEGPEYYLVEDMLQKIMDHYELEADQAFQVLRMDAQEMDSEAFLNFIQMMPLFSDTKMAILDHAQKIQEDRKFWDLLEKSMDSSVILCLIIDEKKEAWKEISARFNLVSMKKITRREMELWIAKQFQLRGKKISREDALRIMEAIGYFEYQSSTDLYYVLEEIEKLSATAETVITQERIVKLLGRPLEENIFLLLQNILEGNRDKTLMLYREYLQSGASLYRVVPMLARNFYQVHLLKKLSERNHPHSSLMSFSGIRSEFILKKQLAAARKSSEEKLRESFEKCLEYEKIYKSESVDMKSHLETLLLELMAS